MTSLSIPVSSDGELRVKPEYSVIEEVKKESIPEAKTDGKKQKQRGRNKDRLDEFWFEFVITV